MEAKLHHSGADIVDAQMVITVGDMIQQAVADGTLDEDEAGALMLRLYSIDAINELKEAAPDNVSEVAALLISRKY